MGDFLGSYYTNILEDEGHSARMALLRVEQPVSILEMEKLLSSKRASAAPQSPESRSSERVSAIDKLHIDNERDVSISRGCSLEDDLEIPVASMSLFETDAMVSVQLQSVKLQTQDAAVDKCTRSRSSTGIGDRGVHPPSPRAKTAHFVETDLSEAGSSFAAVPTTGDVVLGEDTRTPSFKTSFLRFIGRKKRYDNSSKRK